MLAIALIIFMGTQAIMYTRAHTHTDTGTGSYGWHVIYGVGLHFMMGCVSAYVCYFSTEEARSQFAKAKHAKLGTPLVCVFQRPSP
jgi:hypothetical protein